MASVTLHISGLPNEASGRRKSLAFVVVSGNDLVIESRLAASAPVNEHLVWFWGLLPHERRYLKGLQSEGAVLSIRVRGAGRPLGKV
jgi:hypothetical protein